MTHHGNSFITYFTKKKKLSDLEFISIKEFEGKVRTAYGTLSATGDLVSLTANTGKDMYLASAKINVFFIGANSGNQVANVELKLNGVTMESSHQRGGRSNSGVDGTGHRDYLFNLKGIKVLAGQIIKLEVITLGTITDVNGQLTCFEEDTGSTPAI